jgi:hypothetical protein
MKRSKWSGVVAFVAVAGAFLLTGCGGPTSKYPTAPVRGKVTYKSAPVPNGTVMFIPENGPTATGQIQQDGTYVLTSDEANGAVLGSHKVVITALEDMTNVLPEQQSGLPKSIIPSKYSNDVSSGLTAQVADQDNVINFDLTD